MICSLCILQESFDFYLSGVENNASVSYGNLPDVMVDSTQLAQVFQQLK